VKGGRNHPADERIDEASLRVHMAAIRKAPDERQFGCRYISSIAGGAYSFVGSVVRIECTRLGFAKLRVCARGSAVGVQLISWFFEKCVNPKRRLFLAF
jgi:hypothetical protein